MVKTVTTEGICIGDAQYKQCILLTANKVEVLKEIKSLADISNELLERILSKQPDVVLIGTGKSPQWPAKNQYLDWHNAGVGIETMDTPAACRTFNLLMSEERIVAAIMLPLT